MQRSSLSNQATNAHTLEVEIVCRQRIPGEGRFCKWCNISLLLVLEAHIVENESHFLNECDPNAKIRHHLRHKLRLSMMYLTLKK